MGLALSTQGFVNWREHLLENVIGGNTKRPRDSSLWHLVPSKEEEGRLVSEAAGKSK